MRDLRKFATQTQNRLLVGLLILAFTIGLGLIWYFYGGQAALLGLLCLVGILLPMLLIVIILNLIERIAKQ